MWKERNKQKKREKDENESEVKPNKYKEMEKCQQDIQNQSNYVERDIKANALGFLSKN